MNSGSSIALLCLDFDGVLCNSINECMLVAFNAYSGRRHGNCEALPGEYREMFTRLRYLVRDPSEFFFLVDAYYKQEAIGERRFTELASTAPSACREFRDRFFAARREFKDADPKAWLSLNPPYAELVRFIKETSVPVDVVTTKNEESVESLLAEYGIRDRVGQTFGQQALSVYGGKAGAIREACKRRAVSPSNVAYLDDHLKHLADVRETGVQLWYAAWGYTNPAVAEIPTDIRVLTLNSPQRILGGGLT